MVNEMVLYSIDVNVNLVFGSNSENVKERFILWEKKRKIMK